MLALLPALAVAVALESAPAHVVVLVGPLSREARARAVADTKRLLRSLRKLPNVEVQILDRDQVVQPATRDLAEAEVAVDRDLARQPVGPFQNENASPWVTASIAAQRPVSLDRPGKPLPPDGYWLRTTWDAVRQLAHQPGSKSLVYFAEMDARGSGAFLAQMVRDNGVTLFSVFEGAHVFSDWPNGAPADEIPQTEAQVSRERQALEEITKAAGGALVAVKAIPGLIGRRIAQP